MELSYLDYSLILVFLFVLAVVFIRNVSGGISGFSDFFKGGGNLHWIWIAVSLLGTNIQIEYILASASNGFSYGIALGSFEWIGSFVLIITAIYIIPYFLTTGVTTLPEYLEYRYDRPLRLIYAVVFMIINFVMIILILNSSSIFLEKLFGIHREVTIIGVAIVGGVIIYLGGMKGKLRLDLIVICSFLVAGVIMLVFSLIETDGIKNFSDHSDGRLKAILPADNKILPWTGLSGVWVTAMFYFGFFPPIAQAFLVSNSLSEAQKGLLFASSVKLFLPFIMIIPGIVGYELFASQIEHPDFTLPVVIQNIIPSGIQGIILAGYIGTLFTTYNSFLNSSASIFTLDILAKVNKNSPPKDEHIRLFRRFIPVFVIMSILFGTVFKPTEEIFHYSQLLINYFAPIIASVFVFAIFSRRTPSIAAYASTITGIPLFYFTDSALGLPLLDTSALVFVLLCGMMGAIRVFYGLESKVILPEKLKVKFERNLAVVIWGIFILTCGTSIYIVFM